MKDNQLVYFSRNLDKDNIKRVHDMLEIELDGNIAIKVHTGEKGNVNFLRPDYLDDFINYIDGTIVETNTAYDGQRNTTEKHLNLLEEHGWAQFKIDIMDSEGDDYLEIPNGLVLKRNIVGSHLKDYNSCIVLSHFKAHPMGGYGGALKQLSIGFASSKGKKNIHGYGNIKVGEDNLSNVKSKNQEAFLQSMADAASSIVNYFGANNIVYINIMKNIATSCDCDSNAPKAKMNDIGILTSLNPVAIDSACLSLLYNDEDENKKDVIEVIESKNGANILKYAQQLGIGSNQYHLVEVE